jgi:Transposase DDE domain/SWIM zinc finger
MDAREQRGLVIAATQKIETNGRMWFVPSQSGKGRYGVVLGDKPTCSCPDNQETGHKCKHIFAAEFVLKRTTQQANPDGSTTVTTETLTIKTTAERKTYSQDWPAYNAAQVNEREHFLPLLADLCATVPQPAPKGGRKGGRPTLPLSDALFAACYKVFSLTSARRFSGELQEAHDSGFISTLPHYNSVINVFENDDVLPILKELVRLSALPLVSVETKIAIDSSGFSSSKLIRWFDEKYGQPKMKAVWIKAHIATGCRTNVITAADVLEQTSGDCPQFGPLAKETAQGFPGLDYAADKAYTATENFQTVADLGGTLYAPFRVNTTGGIGGIFEKMYHLFCLNRDDYLDKYHDRSNVESTFSAVKRKFGDSVRSKTDTAMKNEVYAKFICHNICCLIAEMYALGIDPTFAKRRSAQEPVLLPINLSQKSGF